MGTFTELPRPPFRRSWPQVYIGNGPSHFPLDVFLPDPDGTPNAWPDPEMPGAYYLRRHGRDGVPYLGRYEMPPHHDAQQTRARPTLITDPWEAWRALHNLHDPRTPQPDICTDLLAYEGQQWQAPGHADDHDAPILWRHSINTRLIRGVPQHVAIPAQVGAATLLYADGIADFARVAVERKPRRVYRLIPRTGRTQHWSGTTWTPVDHDDLPPIDLFISGCDWYDPLSGLAFSEPPVPARDTLDQLRQSNRIDHFTRRILVATQTQATPGPSRHCHIAAQHLVHPDAHHRFPTTPDLIHDHHRLLWPFDLQDYGRYFEDRVDWYTAKQEGDDATRRTTQKSREILVSQ